MLRYLHAIEQEATMNILVIKSSPHKNGASNLLADSFIRGAEEKGHTVTVFDAGHASLHPCSGCGSCGMTGSCVYKDDIVKVRELLLKTDMAVFVTPLYYFSVSSQLKMVIDRFYAYNGELQSKQLKTALIVASWDNKDWTMTSISQYYDTLCKYMSFKDCGRILGTGCGSVDMAKSTEFPNLAYELGKRI